MATKLDPNDITGNMFSTALKKALERHDGSILKLSIKLGLSSRCDAWFKGHFPPYEKMKKIYMQCIGIAGGKDGK